MIKRKLRRWDTHCLMCITRSKKEYEKYGLPCTSDGEILAFSDLGRKDDYSHLWAVIMRLVKCEWFLEVATACYWCEKGERIEDILTQARERVLKKDKPMRAEKKESLSRKQIAFDLNQAAKVQPSCRIMTGTASLLVHCKILWT